ncbi:hypothetical protein [Xylella fastidiosa]|uniref:hypothetical protein n=1 Tax=Xylella fastidiosa TaxID=2371 RepID=UPI000765CF39|nr:hypothetical protein [Xylella fastidiosa]ALR01526.1 hypothetical protein OY18_03955 [Xylella fastidiosa]ALR02754.1 hypothetical protein OY18_11740 [Xylella fastidiosa]KXB11102.1 hypothetical protein ADT29_12495 [Xylella fastidiosa]KXB13436.1 hypothetical protein ADT29_08035 [Xylella fastidiosa]KXB21378.1 hypothetical protein ADT28_05195 [Xylella fastidiosa]
MSPPMPTEMFMRSMSDSELVNDLTTRQAVERFTPVESELLSRLKGLLEDYEEVRDALEQDGDALW